MSDLLETRSQSDVGLSSPIWRLYGPLPKYSSCSLQFSKLSMPSLNNVFSEIGHWHNRGFMQTALTFGCLELKNSETFWSIG